MRETSCKLTSHFFGVLAIAMVHKMPHRYLALSWASATESQKTVGFRTAAFVLQHLRSPQFRQPPQTQELGFSVGAIHAVVVGDSECIAGSINRKTLNLVENNAVGLL